MSDYCWMPTQQFFSYIMARKSWFSMRWWWGQLWSRPTRWVGFFIVHSHWNNSLQVDMSLHSDTLFWFLANQFLLFLLTAAWLSKKQHFIVFDLTPTVAQTHDPPHSRRTITLWYGRGKAYTINDSISTFFMWSIVSDTAWQITVTGASRTLMISTVTGASRTLMIWIYLLFCSSLKKNCV